MMRAKYRKIVILFLIIGIFLSQGPIQNRGFIPLSSGGGGISPDFLDSFSYGGPVDFDSSQEISTHDIDHDRITSLDDFIIKISDGASDEIKGIF